MGGPAERAQTKAWRQHSRMTTRREKLFDQTKPIGSSPSAPLEVSGWALGNRSTTRSSRDNLSCRRHRSKSRAQPVGSLPHALEPAFCFVRRHGVRKVVADVVIVKDHRGANEVLAGQMREMSSGIAEERGLSVASGPTGAW